MSIEPTTGRIYEFGLPDRLRVARELAHLGQRDLAALTGISRQSVYNYEAGITKPRRPQLIVWAMATGFSVAWLESGKVLQPPNGGKELTDEYEPVHGGYVIDFPVPASTADRSTAILQNAA